ncbi:YchF/TatD family DNA exonuclease [Buchnera aphidicola (Muscaphis stroyani)]|uniref:YchF/TatD family DNA exonuclease n=1 Tax=Buchnera aphidicola (Muscaphis stroyani) TaxID=1241869 RepID=A0A4D6YCX7_9GAMM|nr:YchF/TatD family DNA exonuclease [Buchnera aphidicola]QCI24421.1 YchF/TatD family DNA exonuclease [Buchnera aphidicola (Muscaphis stroyani)]
MFFIDSHCHIDQLNYSKLHKNVQDVLKKSDENHVKKMLSVTTSIKNFYSSIKLLKSYKSILFSCGIHPLNCHKEINDLNILEKLSHKKNVIALGETGLDYYYSTETKKLQKKFFREHIKIAIKLKKPIIIHTRNSINDIIKILKEENSKYCTGVVHSFTEDHDAAFQLLNMGFYISFSGVITFKNSTLLREVVKKIPLEYLLIETDSPYLSPVPYRGKENQPAYLLNIANKIAELKKIDLKTLSYITTKNFYKLFNTY